VTKKEIVKDIADRVGLTQQQTKQIVQLTLEAIIETLVNDPEHRIELRNFGVFQVKRRAARSARNPRTNEKVRVPAKNVVTFKPGKRMEELVRNLENVPLLTDDDLSGADEETTEEELATSFGAREN
jgi:nucleoid DNA-binding protein